MARTQLEATGKAYKALIVVGIILAVIGVVRFVANLDAGQGAGVAQMVFGFLIFLLGKFLAWWKHG